MMRWSVVFYYTGLFLKIFSALLLIPIFVGKAYGESFVGLEPYLLAAFAAIVLGVMFSRGGRSDRPEAVEAMTTATISWLIAVGIGALPFVLVAGMTPLNAYFESMSGFTTTGMSLLTQYDLPHSLLFWRAFIQWVGGLGILTFFVAVLVEAGGVAAKLVATEANKTSAGTVRTSLFKAVKSVWYVYFVLTVAMTLLLIAVDVSPFNAVVHAMATLPSGGYASVADLSVILTPEVQAIMTVFMVLAGTNFMLLYGLLKGNVFSFRRDFEFRLYGAVMLGAILIVAADLVMNGMTGGKAIGTAVFHTASVISSTGFMLTPLRDFPELSRNLFFALMFVGASLGSTTGGIKMLRLGIMLKLVRQQIRALRTPPTVINAVTVNGRILEDRELTNVAAIVFLWATVVVVGSFVVLVLSPFDLLEAAQLVTSASSTMGPTFVTKAELIALHPFAKAGLILGMLAGRLEMLPLIGILHIGVAKRLL